MSSPFDLLLLPAWYSQAFEFVTLDKEVNMKAETLFIIYTLKSQDLAQKVLVKFLFQKNTFTKLKIKLKGKAYKANWKENI